MRRSLWRAALIAGVAFGLGGGIAVAGHPHEHHEHASCAPCIPGVWTDHSYDRGRGFIAKKHPYLPFQNTHARAGYPLCISPHAEPSYDHRYSGYYVGGGVGFHHGDAPRTRCEGTWGFDYDGFVIFHHYVMNGWSHGRRYQGGTGSYQPDLPFEVPNVFALKPFAHLHESESGE